jgi:hypothetical protein
MDLKKRSRSTASGRSARLEGQLCHLSTSAAKAFDVSLHQLGSHYSDSIPVLPLSDDAGQQRVDFCRDQLARDDFDLRPIVFTDESMTVARGNVREDGPQSHAFVRGDIAGFSGQNCSGVLSARMPSRIC